MILFVYSYQTEKSTRHKKLHKLVFVKFNAKIKSKISLNNKDPLAAINDEERVIEWPLPLKKNGAPPLKRDEEVFPREPLI